MAFTLSVRGLFSPLPKEAYELPPCRRPETATPAKTNAPVLCLYGNQITTQTDTKLSSLRPSLASQIQFDSVFHGCEISRITVSVLLGRFDSQRGSRGLADSRKDDFRFIYIFFTYVEAPEVINELYR